MPSNAGLYAPRDGRHCKDHTQQPQGLSYLGWFEWAEKMSKTHRQVKCKGCGRYKVWLPKKPYVEAKDAD